MKRFIVIQVSIIIVACIILKILLLNVADYGVLHSTACNEAIFSDTKFPLMSCFSSKENFDLNKILESYTNGSAINGHKLKCNAAIVTASGNIQTYNRMRIEYVTVDKVIEGNNVSNGDEIKLITQHHASHYESEYHYGLRLGMCISDGYTPETHPNLCKRQVLLNSYMNFLKTGHRYLVLFYSTDIGCGPYYYTASSYFPLYFDIDSDYSKPIQHEFNSDLFGNYCDYYENEIFAQTSETIENYLKVKKELFEYFNIDSVN